MIRYRGRYLPLLITVLTLACLTARNIDASAGSTIFSFLKIDTAARTTGMGLTNALVSAQSVDNNPAMLPWIRRDEYSFQHLMHFADISFSKAACVRPIDKNRAYGASLEYVGSNAITRTVADSSMPDGYAEQGSFDYSDMVLSLGYGSRLRIDSSFGVNLRLVQENIDGNTTSGIMASAAWFRYPRRRGYNIGIGMFNIGPSVKGYDLPSGAFLSMGKYFTNSIFGAWEAVAYMDQAIEARGGIEYNINQTVFLRGGCRYPLKDPKLGEIPATNITAGMGIVFSNFSFDYAWLPYGDLGMTHRVSVTAWFDSPNIKKQNAAMPAATQLPGVR